jgi:hypothetical protein
VADSEWSDATKSTVISARRNDPEIASGMVHQSAFFNTLNHAAELPG